MQDSIDCIRQNFQDCITRSCRENKCSLSLKGIKSPSLAIIHGTKYQRKKKYQGKLCDRIIFCREHGIFLAAVELKGGTSIRISEAREQIQNGLSVAMEILGNCSIADWFPILAYRGRMKPAEIKLLQTKPVRFQGKLKNVVKCDCGTSLSATLWDDG